MKNKLILILTLIMLLCVSAFGLSACNEPEDSKNPDIVEVYNQYIAYAEYNGETPLSYEDWLESIKGEKGDKGDKGDQGEQGEVGPTGPQGEDGVTPTIEISEDGYWVINGIKTEVKASGDSTHIHNFDNGDCSCGEKYYSEDLKYVISDDNEYYILTGRGLCADRDIVIPSQYKGKPVKEIKASSFNGDILRSITISNSIISIGDDAFLDCDSLTKVNYKGTIDEWAQIEFEEFTSNPLCYAEKLYINNVLITEAKLTTSTKISNYAFFDCKSLTSVEIGDSVTSIGYYAFSWCSLTSVEIGDSVTSIGYDAFSGCSSLTSVEIGDSVTSIGYEAFEGCYSLTKVNYKGTIDEWAQIEFEDYDSNPLSYAKKLYIKNVLITEAKLTTSTKIRDYAFHDCDSLTSVEIGDSVTSIGSFAFYGCSSLTSVEIPDSVTSIGRAPFWGCTSLTNITFNGTVEEWNAIEKGDGWSDYVPAIYVECSNGKVEI